jgi:hypothetical protein
MAEATAAGVPPDPDRLEAAVRDARDEAAPFALAAAGILVALAFVSRQAHWDLLGPTFLVSSCSLSLWWLPQACR